MSGAICNSATVRETGFSTQNGYTLVRKDISVTDAGVVDLGAQTLARSGQGHVLMSTWAGASSARRSRSMTNRDTRTQSRINVELR